MIRETIKEAMKIRKIKAKDLADHVGVSKSTMSLFLSGKINFRQDNIETILEHLGISLVIR